MNDVYSQYALPAGTMVQEYRIIETLGIGTFGIVYAAQNKFFSEIVALKEFLPTVLARRIEGEQSVHPLSSDTEKAYRWSRHKFLQEAKTLRRLGNPSQHPNIVRVIQFIEANQTAYMVMDLENGRSLKEIVTERAHLPEAEVKSIRDALMDGIERVHGAGVWHRDIKPSNILIRPDGSPVLIDFGAAREDISSTDRSLMSIYSPAYAAPEQIRPIADQGPWTDIYCLGATLYRAVTGKLPTNATKRMQNEALVPAAQIAQGRYSPDFLKSIDATLAFAPKDRPQSIAEWRERFMDPRADTVDQQTQLSMKQEVLDKKIKYLTLALVLMVSAMVLILWFARPVEPPNNKKKIYHQVIKEKPPENEKIEIAEENAVEPPAPVENKAVERIPAKINSVPEKAQVFIDGQLQGATPLEIDIAAGMHQFRLSLEGYHDWNSNLVVEQVSELPIRIPLMKK